MMELEKLLEDIQKPGRYIGGEFNSIKKDWDKTEVKFCISYPDVYEVGMSNLGIRILYHLINEAAYALCERVFAPWPDFEDKLRKNNYSLFSTESRKPLKEFDILGFSLGYELTYANFINMIDLSGIPILSEKRSELPLIVAGGPCVFNPAPLKYFVDIFFIGESEELIMEFLDLFRELKRKNFKKHEMLEALKDINGLYIPAVHDELIKQNNLKIQKRIINDFENVYYPTNFIVPFIKIVHDRAAIEIMRGCPNECGFCQAKNLYRPFRYKTKNRIVELACESLKKTGYEEVSFLSLSSSSHPQILSIIDNFSKRINSKDVKITVPSLRIEDLAVSLPAVLAKNKKTGLTFAPESGAGRLRNIINKKIDINKLYAAAKEAFRNGWRSIKLYFMIGIPGESLGDLTAIRDIAYELSDMKKEIDKKSAEITLSIANFIPKPHTAFQWFGMDKRDILIEKQNYLRSIINKKNITVDFHDVNLSLLESALSRGCRDTGHAICAAWKMGAKFDGWREFFNFEIWKKAFESINHTLEYCATKRFGFEEDLPWEFIDTGISKKYLLDEAKKISQSI